MEWFRARWEKFDADNTFSFTTPRYVRIQDRRLGMPYYAFLGAIVAYIIGYSIILKQGYLLRQPADGVTRLQLLEPVIQYRTPLDQLPYCNNTNSGNTTLYYTSTLPRGFFQYPCLQEDEVRATFPPDELDALFMTTRVSFSNVMSPADCSPVVNVSCDLIQNQTLSTYLANAEMFTLKIDHSLDIEALNLFVSAASLNYEGLIDLNGKRVDPCAPYALRNFQCPTQLFAVPGVFSIASLLQSAGVQDGSLDTVLNTSDTSAHPMTRRYQGMVLVIDIVYSGSLALTGAPESALSYFITAHVADKQYYKIEEPQNPNPGAPPLTVYQLNNRHGIRIVVRQTGLVGEFNFQQLLFTLTTSLTLLKIATTIVDFLAFNLLPLKFIYKQYRTVDTIDFSDLTDSDVAVFRKHDIINPHPKIGLARVQGADARDVETGNAAAPSDVGMELTARKNPLAVAGVQERRHVDQGGFWGDMNRTFQHAWEGPPGADDADDAAKKWHD